MLEMKTKVGLPKAVLKGLFINFSKFCHKLIHKSRTSNMNYFEFLPYRIRSEITDFDGFCLLNHFHKQIGICHSRSHTIRKIAIEGPKHGVLALISVSVNTDFPAHLGSGPQMRAFDGFP